MPQPTLMLPRVLVSLRVADTAPASSAEGTETRVGLSTHRTSCSLRTRQRMSPV